MNRALTCAALLLLLPPTQEPAPLLGYDGAGSRAERELESRFRATPNPDSLRSYLRTLAARPQHVGSAYGKQNAEWLVATFRSWGLDARIEMFETLFPTPRVRVLELLGKPKITARLQEPAVAGDQYSSQKAEQLPSYNAYSVDGDVTGPLVFVNYGVPADYEELERRGISVKGAIVIAKYGGSWRGIKPKVAAEHGAIGCLIYSDPKDDGYGQGDVYPKGPYRPADGVQRGSVADMPLYPGDPGTPFVGAVPGTRSLPLDSIATLTRIPVLPISYADATPLLAALEGEVVPPSWRGGLPLTYKTGPSQVPAHLKLQFTWDRAPLYNVIVRIPGAEFPDEWVVRGNHRDGWVNGAEDPLSGLIAEMEELRGLAQLLKQGWRPRRTIIYAAWDGEEPGLIGSTEWVEAHRDELKQKTVLYLNTDSNGRGFFGAGGSHSLERFVNEVARDITDPETGATVWERTRAAAIAQGGDLRARARSGGDLPIEALGSGSDFTPFLQHAGLPSLNLGFGGEGGNGIYHSIYDNYNHFTRFNDTSFVYGRALAQTVGTAILRMAMAPVLPYQFAPMSRTYDQYAGELKSLLESRRTEAVERNRQLDERIPELTGDPWSPRKAPARADVPPYLDFSPLDNALARLRIAAAAYDLALGRADRSAPKPAVNGILFRVEQALTSTDGLPRRPWFRHLIYAPGFYTGYGVKTMPGPREAIEQGYWAEADREIGRVGERLQAAAALIDQAREALGTTR
ncbi:MAG: transferrin receptor-like dimerization domain-containing protein [Gemmatimonadales bacterium]